MAPDPSPAPRTAPEPLEAPAVLAPARPARDFARGAVFAVGLGSLGAVGWMVPILGIPMTAAGLVLGWRALSMPRRRLAILGMALCVVFLVLGLMNGGLDAFAAITGRALFGPQALKALLKR